jgi:hypothetical protein
MDHTQLAHTTPSTGAQDRADAAGSANRADERPCRPAQAAVIRGADMHEAEQADNSRASRARPIGPLSPAVVTWGTTIPFGLTGTAGAAAINFTNSGGALPTGIVAGTNYYVILSSISGNTFQIATSADNAIAGTAINTSGSQSGTHTGIPAAILATGTAVNIAAVSVPAGDYDARGTNVFAPAAATTITVLQSRLSATSASSTAIIGYNSRVAYASAGVAIGANFVWLPVGPSRFSLAATSTIYLIAPSTFATDVLSAGGGLSLRRVP